MNAQSRAVLSPCLLRSSSSISFPQLMYYMNGTIMQHNSKVAIGSETDTVSLGNIQTYLN